MPGPILESLSRAARLAFPIIQRGVREGLSANSIQELLQRHNLGIRRQSLLDIIRGERGILETVNVLRFLPGSARPNPARLPEALTTIRRQFSFTVEVTGTLLSTGVRRTQMVTVATDRLLTRSQIEEIAASTVTRHSDTYGMEVEEALVLTGKKAGEAGTF